jgi:hypothetical protein|tara:strand:+ start:1056 stop:1250 length:195 start_codon:yes stop_codon:yes gene_type:complete
MTEQKDLDAMFIELGRTDYELKYYIQMVENHTLLKNQLVNKIDKALYSDLHKEEKTEKNETDLG